MPNSHKRHTRSIANPLLQSKPPSRNRRYNVNLAIEESKELKKLKNIEELAEHLEAEEGINAKKREKANHNLAMSLQKGSNNISAANLKAIKELEALNRRYNVNLAIEESKELKKLKNIEELSEHLEAEEGINAKKRENANLEVAKKLQKEYNNVKHVKPKKEPVGESKESDPPLRYFARTRSGLPGNNIPKPKSRPKSKSMSNSKSNTKPKSKSNTKSKSKRWWPF